MINNLRLWLLVDEKIRDLSKQKKEGFIEFQIVFSNVGFATLIWICFLTGCIGLCGLKFAQKQRRGSVSMSINVWYVN